MKSDNQQLADMLDDFMTDNLGMIQLEPSEFVEYAIAYGDIQARRRDFSGVAVAVDFGRKHASTKAERDAIAAMSKRGWAAAGRTDNSSGES